MRKENIIYILWTHILTYMKIKQFKKYIFIILQPQLFFQQYKTHSQDTLQAKYTRKIIKKRQAQDGVCTAKRNNFKKHKAEISYLQFDLGKMCLSLKC